jgi:putative FmdB family regulatory protein
MPFYSYQCQSCSNEFQTLVYPDETPTCPSCGSEKLEQMLSLIARPAKGGPAEAACGTGSPACATCPAAAGAFG